MFFLITDDVRNPEIHSRYRSIENEISKNLIYSVYMHIKAVNEFTNDLFFLINVRHFPVLELLHFFLNQVWKSNLIIILQLYLHSNEEENIVKIVEIRVTRC